MAIVWNECVQSYLQKESVWVQVLIPVEQKPATPAASRLFWPTGVAYNYTWLEWKKNVQEKNVLFCR